MTLQEFNGAQKFSPEPEEGTSPRIETKWFGCFPSSISGYTISSDIDPLQNNIGFWANVQRRDNTPDDDVVPAPPKQAVPAA